MNKTIFGEQLLSINLSETERAHLKNLAQGSGIDSIDDKFKDAKIIQSQARNTSKKNYIFSRTGPNFVNKILFNFGVISPKNDLKKRLSEQLKLRDIVSKKLSVANNYMVELTETVSANNSRISAYSSLAMDVGNTIFDLQQSYDSIQEKLSSDTSANSSNLSSKVNSIEQKIFENQRAAKEYIHSRDLLADYNEDMSIYLDSIKSGVIRVEGFKFKLDSTIQSINIAVKSDYSHEEMIDTLEDVSSSLQNAGSLLNNVLTKNVGENEALSKLNTVTSSMSNKNRSLYKKIGSYGDEILSSVDESYHDMMGQINMQRQKAGN